MKSIAAILTVFFLICSSPISGFINQQDVYSPEKHASIAIDSIKYPWSLIDITAKEMKPGLFLVESQKKKNRALPYLIGIPAAGSVVYFLTKKDDDSTNCAFTITTSVTSAKCSLENGSAMVELSPPGDYVYTWSNGATTNSIENLAPGNYTVLIELNGTDCSQSLNLTIPVDQSDFQLEIITTDEDCNLGNGSAEAIVTPPDNYSYIWSDGNSNPVNSGLNAGTYTLTVTDSNGCSKVENITIEETLLEVDINFTNIPADCGIDNGSSATEVTPSGSYDYQWSDGTTSQSAENLSAGTISVTVTNEDGCTTSATTIIESLEPEIITSTQSIPGNCVDGGDIIVNLSSNDVGLIELNISGPIINTQVTTSSGTISLASSTDLPPGDYTLIAFNQTAGINCSDTSYVSIPDSTDMIQLLNDTFQTELNVSLTENVLKNDQGFHLSVVAIDSIIGGTISFASDGSFTFNPQSGFNGTASFLYIARDTCSTRDTAYVHIIVNETNCDFNVQFVNQPASCGLNDGSAFASVIENGNYTYLWNNGDIGQTLSNVPAGIYSVTITDIDLNCPITFETEITETPPVYIDQMEVMQASCTFDANIIFEFGATTIPAFDIEVIYPDEDDEFTVSPGVIFLGDYVPIVEGNYSISVTPSGVGYPCIESFMATINSTEGLTIEAVDISPTSSPTASDGAVTIQITNPGVEPYDVIIDGDLWTTVTGDFFTIGDLFAAEYMIQITDAEGCTSNLISVVIPIDPNLSVRHGISMVFDNYDQVFMENIINDIPNYSHYYSFNTILDYKFLGLSNTSILNLGMGVNFHQVRYSHLMDIWQYNRPDIQYRLQTGIHTNISTKYSLEWLINSQINIKLPNNTNAGISLGLRINEESTYPLANMIINKPFGLKPKIHTIN